MEIDQNKINQISKDLNKYLQYFLSGIVVSGGENLAQIKDKKVLFLPNHLSLMETILIPKILNDYGLSHPAIIAGDNLDHWPFNKIMNEKNGTIFMNRKVFSEGSREEILKEGEKIRKNIEEVVEKDYNLMAFIEGTRGNPEEIMKDAKKRYPLEYIKSVKKSGKNFEDYFLMNVALSYSPHSTEKPFVPMANFFRKKIFLMYLLSDVLAFGTQPFREKPKAIVKFGKAVSLEKYIEEQNFNGIIDLSTKEIKKMYSEIYK